MKTLYHASKIENKEWILKEGLEPSLSEKESNDERLNTEAVYGFDNPEDCMGFAMDNGMDEFVIFQFRSDSCIIDPEYDGESFAVTGTENIPCTIFKEYLR